MTKAKAWTGLTVSEWVRLEGAWLDLETEGGLEELWGSVRKSPRR